MLEPASALYYAVGSVVQLTKTLQPRSSANTVK